jgi:predicted hotdog family 3-hydroxylacyl-ACP dehydratase
VNPIDWRPDRFLPHRGHMLLVDEILVLDDGGAVTRSVVTEKWPFFDGRSVTSIVLIELVAQTAGIHNGWVRENLHGPAADRRGWIVGIRQARLFVDTVPLCTHLVTRTENRMEFEGFRDICGVVEMETKTAAEITLQLLRFTPTD